MRSGGTPSATPAGVAAGTGVVVLVLLGWALGYTALTVAAAAGLGALIAGFLVTLRVPRLEISRVIEPARVERGVPAVGLVAVRNPGRRRTRACTAIDLVADDEVSVAIPALAAGRTISVRYDLPTHRRGALTVGPLAITNRDPVGLWQARRRVGEEATLLVLPRVHPLSPRPAGRARNVEGPVSDTAPRGTLTFHSLREYVPGDDIRRIHWRSSARTGTLMVREHVDTSQPSTVVVLDTRAVRYEEDGFEEAVDVATSVVVSSQNNGFPVQLLTTDGARLMVRAGQRGQDVRDFLATVQATDDGGDLSHAAVAVRQSRAHDAIAVVSGEIDTRDLATITLMTRGFASPALVTLRMHDGDASRWTAGPHHDGPTAADALARWQAQTSGPHLLGAAR